MSGWIIRMQLNKGNKVCLVMLKLMYAALCRERYVTQTKCIFLLYPLNFYTCIGAVYFVLFIHLCIKSMSIV